MTKSDTTDEMDRSGGLARRVRLGMALELLPIAKREEAGALPRWLRMQPAPGPADVQDPTELLMVVSADLGRVQWRAAGVPNRFGDSVGEVLRAVGAADSAWDDLGETAAALAPTHLGTWLQLSEQGLDGGWLLGGDLSLAAALGRSPRGEAPDALRVWSDRAGATACSQLRRSVAPERPATELSIPLPGEAPALQLAVAEQAFDEMTVPWIGDHVAEMLGQAAPKGEGLLMQIALEAAGPVRAAVLAPHPSTEVVLALVDAVDGVSEEVLGELETVLGSEDGPAWIACARYARGVEVELYYRL